MFESHQTDYTFNLCDVFSVICHVLEILFNTILSRKSQWIPTKSLAPSKMREEMLFMIFLQFSLSLNKVSIAWHPISLPRNSFLSWQGHESWVFCLLIKLLLLYVRFFLFFPSLNDVIIPTFFVQAPLIHNTSSEASQPPEILIVSKSHSGMTLTSLHFMSYYQSYLPHW